MKRSQVFPTTFLGKDDVQAPFCTVIRDVRMEKIKGENGEEDKAVLHFADQQIKAMIINSTNWTTLEDAYGEDSDMWRGKQVEIYIDPSVMFGGRRIGGLRVRIPSGANQMRPSPAPLANGWTMAEAVAECEKVGLTRGELVAKLKANGGKGWNTERDTPIAKGMIEDKQGFGEQGGGMDSAPAEEIPF